VPFDNIISRADADALIPTEQAGEILKVASGQSAALALLRRTTMSTKVAEMPVLSALPVSYWVAGDTGLKQTSEASWVGATLTAEELATIVPVPENVINDADFDVWAELRDPIAEAIGLKLDQAVFQGLDKPASWPAAIIPAAQAAGNVASDATTPEEGGIYGAVEAAMSLVEDDGFTPTAVAAATTLKRAIRRARSAQGELLGEGSTASIWDLPIGYVMPTTFPATVSAVVGDFDLGMIAVRQDITYKLLDQAVISDDTGKVIFNLPQQDMLALRVTARFAFAVGVPATRAGAANAYPFALVADTTP
jgi:HK97 family phage major capsid protein